MALGGRQSYSANVCLSRCAFVAVTVLACTRYHYADPRVDCVAVLQGPLGVCT